MRLTVVDVPCDNDKYKALAVLEYGEKQYRKLVISSQPIVYDGDRISRQLYKAVLEACRDIVYDQLMSGREVTE